MKRLIAALSLAIATLFTSSPALAAEPIAGRWITEDRDAVITIARCGQNYCGRITRFIVPPPQGADQRDVNNDNPALRNRRLMGMAVLTGFREDGNVWRGRIYDPKGGDTYRSVLRRTSASRLEVKGCLGPFCQTQIWRRAN